jgi:hypothetical protein
MPLTGQFDVLREWERRIGALAADATRTAVSREMAEAALELVADDFSGEHGPFGARWKAKKIADGRPIGVGRTGKLSKYRIRHVDGVSFRIGSDASYAKYFHGGTKRMRARQVVPNNGRMPAAWGSRFERIWHAHCLLVLRGAR